MSIALPLIDIPTAWTAAAHVAAATYGIEPAAITAPSRGRGPRPPRNVWDAKKMAVHLAVLVSGCDYAALGRHLGLHRDTVASHCAAMREAAMASADAEELSRGLELAVRARASTAAVERLAAVLADASNPFEKLVGALHEFTAAVHPTFIRQNAAHPTAAADHTNVMARDATAKVGAR